MPVTLAVRDGGAPALSEPVAVATLLGVDEPLGVVVGEAVRVELALSEPDGELDDVGDTLPVALSEGVGVGVGVALAVTLLVGVLLGLTDGVGDGDGGVHAAEDPDVTMRTRPNRASET